MKRGIDHVVLCVRDLEEARRAYGRLGFTTTPPAAHPFGTANRLVQIGDSYLELLAIADPAAIPPPRPGYFSFGAFNRAFLERRQGMSMLALKSDDARADGARFAAAGLHPYEPFEFSRSAPRPDGSEATVSFTIAFLAEPGTPEAAFFVCQHRSAEALWAPAYQRHANTASAIAEVIMVAEAPMELAEFFGRLLGADAVTGAPEEVSAGGMVRVLSPAQFAERYPDAKAAKTPSPPYFAGFRVAVADIAAAGAALARRKLRFGVREGVLSVDPRETLGISIELAAETAS